MRGMVTELAGSLIQRLGGRIGGGVAPGPAFHLAVQRCPVCLDIGAQVPALILRNANRKKPSSSNSLPRITDENGRRGGMSLVLGQAPLRRPRGAS
jgi:hypothetical protein